MLIPSMAARAVVSDSLGARYSEMSNDGSLTPVLREAATLFTLAEGHLQEEQEVEARKVAEKAREQFLAAGEHSSAADAFRIVIHALLFREQRQEAMGLAKEELKRLRASAEGGGPGGSAGEAQVLLALAEASSEGWEANMEETLTHAKDATKMFRARGDAPMEANGLLVQMKLQLSREDMALAVEALQFAQQAHEIFKAAGDKRGEASALHGIASASIRCRALGAAENMETKALPSGGGLEAAREALRLFQEAKLPKMEAVEKICVAQWLTAENPRRGLRAADEALAFCQEVGSAQEHAALSAVVHAHLAIKDISKAWMDKEAAEAVQKVRKVLARLRAKGDKFGEGQALSSLVLASKARGDLGEASSAAEMAVKIFQSVGHKALESSMLQLASDLYLKTKRPNRALSVAKQISSLSSSLQERAAALETVHEVNLQRGDLQSARGAAEELLALCEEASEGKRGAVARLMLARVHLAEQDFGEAVAVAREAQAMLNDLGAAKEEAEALRVVAEVQVASKEFEAALRAAGKAKKLLQQVGNQQHEEASILFLIAQVRLNMLVAESEAGSPLQGFQESAAESAQAAEEAAALAAGLGNESLAGSALCVLAQVRMTSLQIDTAQKALDEAMRIFLNLADARNQASVMCIQADIDLANGKATAALRLADKAAEIYRSLGDKRGEAVATGIREHIAGPTIVQEEEKPQEQWTEEEWKRWEEWQQQQQQQQQLQQQQLQVRQSAQPPAQLETLRKKREPSDLGARLDMSNLNPLDLQQKLTNIVSNVVEFDEEDEFEMDQPLMMVGVTSKTAVALRNTLTDEFPGVSLPFTMVFDYPSVNAISEYILMETGNPPLMAG